MTQMVMERVDDGPNEPHRPIVLTLGSASLTQRYAVTDNDVLTSLIVAPHDRTARLRVRRIPFAADDVGEEFIDPQDDETKLVSLVTKHYRHISMVDMGQKVVSDWFVGEVKQRIVQSIVSRPLEEFLVGWEQDVTTVIVDAEYEHSSIGIALTELFPYAWFFASDDYKQIPRRIWHSQEVVCKECGHGMRPAGDVLVCENCGSVSGAEPVTVIAHCGNTDHAPIPAQPVGDDTYACPSCGRIYDRLGIWLRDD